MAKNTEILLMELKELIIYCFHQKQPVWDHSVGGFKKSPCTFVLNFEGDFGRIQQLNSSVLQAVENEAKYWKDY